MTPTRIALLLGMTTILATTLSAQTFTVLHNFEFTDGLFPGGMLTNDSTGKLYGTTSAGGDTTKYSEGYGVLFQLASRNGTWQESVLHKFSAGHDGAEAEPADGLIAGPGGNGYGTAPWGGSFTQRNCNRGGGCGTVYQIGSNGKFSVIYSFTGAPDGEHPFSALLAGPNGLLYGTTEEGGNLDCPFDSFGCGTVFQVNANGAEQVIYSFLGPNNNSDGANPFSALIKDAAGNLYGGTSSGGTINKDNCENAGCGTIFELTPNNDGSWTETILYCFQGGADGTGPAVSFFSDADDSIYGTTPEGGNLSACGGTGCGTIFKLTKTNGQWTKTTVYAFSGPDGDVPSPLTRDTAGNLYGTTTYGGDLNCIYVLGCGVVFKVSPNGIETVLHTFSGNDGLFPEGGVLVYRDALYGTTTEGGDIANCSLPEYYTGCGVVYEISR